MANVKIAVRIRPLTPRLVYYILIHTLLEEKKGSLHYELFICNSIR